MDVVKKANELARQDHIAHEVRQNLQDLVVIIKQLDAAAQAGNTGSADVRFLQRKNEEIRSEKRKVEKEVESLRSVITSTVPLAIKGIGSDVAAITELARSLQNEDLKARADHIKVLLRELIESLAKGNPAPQTGTPPSGSSAGS